MTIVAGKPGYAVARFHFLTACATLWFVDNDDLINLNDSTLGQRLLEEPKSLPLDVFQTYVLVNGRKRRLASELIERYLYPDPRSSELFAPINPEDAVRQLHPLVAKIGTCLHRPHPALKKAKELLDEAKDILEFSQATYCSLPRGRSSGYGANGHSGLYHSKVQSAPG